VRQTCPGGGEGSNLQASVLCRGAATATPAVGHSDTGPLTSGGTSETSMTPTPLHTPSVPPVAAAASSLVHPVTCVRPPADAKHLDGHLRSKKSGEGHVKGAVDSIQQRVDRVGGAGHDSSVGKDGEKREPSEGDGLRTDSGGAVGDNRVKERRC
jgi:hypothetical protein